MAVGWVAWTGPDYPDYPQNPPPPQRLRGCAFVASTPLLTDGLQPMLVDHVGAPGWLPVKFFYGQQ